MNKPKKTQVSKLVEKIKVDEVDITNNKVVSILSKYNEFVIYEIDVENIQNRIRILIDGHTDESEELIKKRLNKVKSSYIQAKGILLHSTNFEINKQRVAHTLSTYLINDDELKKEEEENKGYGKLFDGLIDSIHKEQDTIFKHRMFYITPVVLMTILLIFGLFFKRHISEFIILEMPLYEILCHLLSIFIGTCISLSINSKNLNFQEFSSWQYYVLSGLERLLIAIFMYFSSIILIKSEIILSSIVRDNSYSIMFFLLLVGFSERLIPSMLNKVESELNKQ